MRWYDKPRPKRGDRRQVTKFLWFPLWIHGEGRWFEEATFIEEYQYIQGDPDAWVGIQWVNI